GFPNFQNVVVACSQLAFKCSLSGLKEREFFYLIVFIDSYIIGCVAYCKANIDQKIYIANINDICSYSQYCYFIN
ncbi:hypothetical protein, partial [Vibrio splendidus]|uniref:hypothetical protein n=1 Tax=Vibrio splendidus TaxID=29497 RepID=UPI001A7E0F35